MNSHLVRPNSARTSSTARHCCRRARTQSPGERKSRASNHPRCDLWAVDPVAWAGVASIPVAGRQPPAVYCTGCGSATAIGCIAWRDSAEMNPKNSHSSSSENRRETVLQRAPKEPSPIQHRGRLSRDWAVCLGGRRRVLRCSFIDSLLFAFTESGACALTCKPARCRAGPRASR